MDLDRIGDSVGLDDFGTPGWLRRVTQVKVVDDLGLRQLLANDFQHGGSPLFAGDLATHEDASVDAVDPNPEFVGSRVIRDGLFNTLIGVLVLHAAVTLTGIS
jgi:hypothetical protein